MQKFARIAQISTKVTSSYYLMFTLYTGWLKKVSCWHSTTA